LVEPVSARGFFGSVTGSAGGWTRVKSIEPVLKLAELVFKKLHTTFWLIEQTGRAKKCNSSKTGWDGFEKPVEQVFKNRLSWFLRNWTKTWGSLSGELKQFFQEHSW
jgi:hypothetical protein